MPDNNITKSNISTSGQLFAEIRQILIGARQTAYKAVNFAMVTAYWNIGRLIVEDEQQGSTRAEYGKAVLADLSVRLTEEFGKGFTEANLRNMRQFYQCFPNCYALRSELTWTHYRLLIRVQDEAARQWYMNEAAEQTWSSRQLDRQISVLYYERLLASKDTRPVREEAAQNLSLITPQDFTGNRYREDIDQQSAGISVRTGQGLLFCCPAETDALRGGRFLRRPGILPFHTEMSCTDRP